MPHLVTDPNLADPDAFYERLIGAHQGLDDTRSMALNARLVLLLANHIGDARVLDEALAAAREGLDPRAPDATLPPTQGGAP